MRILISILAMVCLSFSSFAFTDDATAAAISKNQIYSTIQAFTLTSLSNNTFMIVTGPMPVFLQVTAEIGADTAALTTWELYLTRNFVYSNRAGGFTNVKYIIGYSNEQQSTVSNVFDCVNMNFNPIQAVPYPVQTWYKIGSANGASKWTGVTNVGVLIKTIKNSVVGAQYPYAKTVGELAPNTGYFLQISNSTAAASNFTAQFDLQFRVLR